MRYQILSVCLDGDGASDALIRKVEAAISQGWKPLGGIAVATETAERYGHFHQAMVLEEEGD